MTDNIQSIEGVIAKKAFYAASDSDAVTPEQTLRAVLADLEDGTLEADGLIICTTLKDCKPDWYALRLHLDQAIGLLETVKMGIGISAYK